MGVTLGGTQVGMAEKCLNVTDIGTAFQKMRGKGVTQAVYRKFLGNTRAGRGFGKDVLGGTYGQRAVGGLTGEKPSVNRVIRNVPFELRGGFLRKYSTAIFAAFALAYVNHTAAQVNVLALERDNFADAQSR